MNFEENNSTMGNVSSYFNLEEKIKTNILSSNIYNMVLDTMNKIIEKKKSFQPWDFKYLYNDFMQLFIDLPKINEQLSSILTDDEKIELIKANIDKILDPSFFDAYFSGVFDSIEKTLDEFSKSVFATKFEQWIKILVEEHGGVRESISRLVKVECDHWGSYMTEAGFALRSINDIGNDLSESAIRQILKAYFDLAEGIYFPYLHFVYDLFCICGLEVKDNAGKQSNGTIARLIDELFIKYYPEFVSLINSDVASFRNAIGHKQFIINEDDCTIYLFTVFNKTGEKSWERTLTFSELNDTYKSLEKMVWFPGGDLYCAYFLTYYNIFMKVEKEKLCEQIEILKAEFDDNIKFIKNSCENLPMTSA